MNYSKLKKGDKFTLRDSTGVLVTNPEYICDDHSGLYYADVEWDNGKIQKTFMICRTDIRWVR